jgi:electron transfer flavoprotein alpha subunit
MKIVVCIKQVPDTAEVRIDPEKGTLIRKGVPAVVNPLDLHALEAAVRLAERYGGTVHALSMGPAAAEEALRECLALGADEAWLCTGKEFAGADTWATATTLAAAIRYLGGREKVDLVLCGKQAIDGDTAQVGPELSVCLGWPLVPYAEEITLEGAAPGGDDAPRPQGRAAAKVRSMTETGYAVIRTNLPAVMTAVKDISVPRLPSLPGWARALTEPVRRITPADLDLSGEETGLRGSPTRVRKIQGVVHTKETEFPDPGKEGTVRRIAEILLAAGSSQGKPRSSDGAGESGTVPPRPAGTAPEGGAVIAVIGEIDDRSGGLAEVSFELCAAARRLAEARSGRVVFAVPGDSLEESLAEAELPGAEEYAFIETGGPGFEANRYADAVAAWAGQRGPEILLGPGTLKGRAMMPLVAARLETGLTADCTGLEIDPETGLLLQTRPAFGGNVLATITCESRRPQMATVRPQVFSGGLRERTGLGLLRAVGNPPRTFRAETPEAGEGYPSLITEETLVSEGSDISDAPVILSGGRGLGGPEGFELLHRTAELTGGAVGASRSAVEAGWAEYVRQVGQTGKTVQPAVYFAVGISGAVQHLVGMHDSEFVIAVNRDPEAPIFGAADIGIVADYRSFLGSLIKYLEEMLG